MCQQGFGSARSRRKLTFAIHVLISRAFKAEQRLKQLVEAGVEASGQSEATKVPEEKTESKHLEDQLVQTDGDETEANKGGTL